MIKAPSSFGEGALYLRMVLPKFTFYIVLFSLLLVACQPEKNSEIPPPSKNLNQAPTNTTTGPSLKKESKLHLLLFLSEKKIEYWTKSNSTYTLHKSINFNSSIDIAPGEYKQDSLNQLEFNLLDDFYSDKEILKLKGFQNIKIQSLSQLDLSLLLSESEKTRLQSKNIHSLTVYPYDSRINSVQRPIHSSYWMAELDAYLRIKLAKYKTDET